MDNDLKHGNDEATRFTTNEDVAARMRDEAAVNLAQQVHEWAKDNLGRFDANGNERVNFAELDLGKRTAGSSNDSKALAYLQDNYKQIQDHSQNKFLFIKGAGGLSVDGIGEWAQDLEKQRDENAKALEAKIQERSLQAGSKDLLAPLMANNGTANKSLFRVIDGLDGDIDNEVSKRDLNRYLDTYQRRARTGEIGEGFFTPDTRRYVENLRDNWDSKEVRRLRGTWVSREHDGEEKEHANGEISEKSIKSALGLNKHGDMYQPFVMAKQQAEPVVRAADQRGGKMTDAQPARQEKSADIEPVVEPPPAVTTKAKAAESVVAHGENQSGETKSVKPVKEKVVAAKPVAAEPATNRIAEVAVDRSVSSGAGALNKAPMHSMDVSSAVAARIKSNFLATEDVYSRQDAEAASADRSAVMAAAQLNEWGKDNLRRFDTSGDHRVNYGEIDLGLRTSNNATDSKMLAALQSNYEPIQEQSGGNFLFIRRPDAISQKDLQVNVEKAQEIAEANEKARQAAFDARSANARNSHLLAGLLASPDGNPNRSLFRVIDGLDNDIDSEISRKDLRRYLTEYERRSSYEDIGTGFYTSQTRRYVEFLNNNWDSKDVVSLRGTYTDHDNRTHANSTISLERLTKLLAMGKRQDIFQRFSLDQR